MSESPAPIINNPNGYNGTLRYPSPPITPDKMTNRRGKTLTLTEREYAAGIAEGLSMSAAARKVDKTLFWAQGQSKRADIHDYIERLRAEAFERQVVTLQEVIRDLSDMARADLRDAFEEDGTPKSPTELPKELAALIRECKAREFHGAVTHTIKFTEKTAVLDQLLKIMGGYAPDKLAVAAVPVDLMEKAREGEWRTVAAGLCETAPGK